MAPVLSLPRNEAASLGNPDAHGDVAGLAQALEMEWSETSTGDVEKPFVKALATGLVLSGALWALIAGLISLI